MHIQQGLNSVKGIQLNPARLTMPGVREFEGTCKVIVFVDFPGAGNWSAKTQDLKFQAKAQRPIELLAVFHDKDAEFAKGLCEKVKGVRF